MVEWYMSVTGFYWVSGMASEYNMIIVPTQDGSAWDIVNLHGRMERIAGPYPTLEVAKVAYLTLAPT